MMFFIFDENFFPNFDMLRDIVGREYQKANIVKIFVHVKCQDHVQMGLNQIGLLKVQKFFFSKYFDK
jgi:hypothetical protein